MYRLALALCVLALMAGCGEPRETGPLVVLADVGLADVFTELAERHEKAHPGARVACTFIASSEALGQVLAATSADIVFCGDPRLLERLAFEGKLLPDSRREFYGNRLAVVGAREGGVSIAAASELAGAEIARIAVAAAGVPAGDSARAWLSSRGLLSTLEPRLVTLPDARAVLGAVASGKAQVGLVYTTEVRTAENVQVVLSIPDAEQPKIIYASAIPADSRRPRMAAEFLRYVYSPWGITAFRRHGFTLPEGPPE